MDHPWMQEFSDAVFSLSDYSDGLSDRSWRDSSSDDDDAGEGGGQGRKRQAQASMKAQKNIEVAPRTIKDIGSDINAEKHLEIGHAYDRETCVVRIREYGEFRQAPFKFDRQQSERIESRCGSGEECEYCHVFTFDKRADSMMFRSFRAHTCEQNLPASKSTCYTAEILVLVPELLALGTSKRHPSAAEISTACSNYVRKPLGDSMVQDIRTKLQARVYGREKDEVKNLGRYMQCLKNDGHQVHIEIATKEQMIDLSMEYQKGRHERTQKDVEEPSKKQPWSALKDEVEQSLKEMYAQNPENARYPLAVSIGFRAYCNMVPLLRPVFFSDAAHMKGPSVGAMIYSTVAIDANHHIVPISVTWVVGAESFLGWNFHIKFLRYFCLLIGFILNHFTVIIDGFSAAIRLFRSHGFLIFMCSVHFKKNIKNKQCRDLYEEALYARSPAILQKIKDKAKTVPETADFFTKLQKNHPDSELFMIASGKTFGQHCQSAAEAWNAMLKEPRRALHLVGQFLIKHTFLCVSTMCACSFTCTCMDCMLFHA